MTRQESRPLRPLRSRALISVQCVSLWPALMLLGTVALGGCTSFTGHPVRASLPRLASGAAAPAAADLPDDPHDPRAGEVADFLFLGLQGVWRPIEKLRSRHPPAPDQPLVAALPRLAEGAMRRYGAMGFGGRVRSAVAVVAVGRVPLPPAQMADLIMDPEVERQVLGANSFRPLGATYRLPGARRERFAVEILRVGAGPIRVDLRFTVVAERRDTADGRVLLRYDPDTEPRPEHVTLYRGGCLLEPDAGGTRVTEILIVGTDVSVPFFLESSLRQLARATLKDRATNLWIRAWRPR